MEEGWSGGAAGKLPNDEGTDIPGRLFLRKRLPHLTWWLEGVKAVGAVMLLPVIACTPFKTIQQHHTTS